MAIDHAQAAADADRVARLVAALAQPAYADGRVDTVRRWLAWLEERGLVERYPPVAVLGAWVQALVGRPAAAPRWADAAEGRSPAAAGALGTQTPADGSTMESHQAMLRALLCRDDVDRMRADARAVLRQASDILQLRPNLGTLPAQVQELRARLDTAREATLGASSLTTAELRLLPFLATHLTLREIGQRLYLSHNTVKTQAISIYRKLGASSRSQAVQRVQEIGLLTT